MFLNMMLHRVVGCVVADVSKVYVASFFEGSGVNTLRTGDADLRFYITTVQDG